MIMGEGWKYIAFILIGYLSGSVLYAEIIPKYLFGIDPAALSDDHNPGAFNAFKYAGKKAGILVIIMELLKGIVPIAFAVRMLDPENMLFACVLAAPVLGHAFPFLKWGQGGKAIAVSFGCLIGLLPDVRMVLILVVLYLIFSLVIVILPHLLRSILTYILFSLICLWKIKNPAYTVGAFLISAIVIFKHVIKFEKEPVSIHLF